MASLFFRYPVYSIILSILFIHTSRSTNIVCDSWRECRYSSLTCVDNEDCNVLCTSTQTCYGAVIYCPTNAQCNVECGSDWKSCEYIYVDAHGSTALNMYCSGDTCNSANIYCPNNGFGGTDHLCSLDGDSTLKDIAFHTEEGFNDLEVSIALVDSFVFCGSNGQFECPFDDCMDGVCRDYRLPTPTPVKNVDFLPTLDPTSPTKNPSPIPTSNHYVAATPVPTSHLVVEMQNPTSYPSHSNLPVQIYNEESDRLEFYVYFNDSNGINMVLGKWILREMLETYEQVTGVSYDYYGSGIYDAETEWKMSGFLNVTLCVAFNMPYEEGRDDPHCQRFQDYGFEASQRRRLKEHDLSDPSIHHAEYVAYGTFGLISNEKIDLFQSFVISTLSSEFYRLRYNGNMNAAFPLVEFDDIFTAIKIIVLPYSTGSISVNNFQSESFDASIYQLSHKHIAFYLLSGMCLCLLFLACICCLMYAHFRCKKRRNKNQEGVRDEGRARSLSPEDTTEKIHLNMNNTRYKVDDEEDSRIESTIQSLQSGLQLPRQLSAAKLSKNDSNISKDSKYSAGHLGYISTDNESPYDDDDMKIGDESLEEKDDFKEAPFYLRPMLSFRSSNNEKSQKEASHEKSHSVLSTLMAFGKKKLKSPKQASDLKNHQRSASDMQKIGQKRSDQHVRAYHWGFTNDGAERSLRMSLGMKRAHSANPVLHSGDGSHRSTMDSTGYLTVDHSASIQRANSDKRIHFRNQSQQSMSLRIKRKSSSLNGTVIHHHSNRNSNQNSLESNSSQKRRLNPFQPPSMDSRNELKALSPSSGGMDDMYGTPSPDGDVGILPNLTRGIDPVLMAMALEPPNTTHRQTNDDLHRFSVDIPDQSLPASRPETARKQMPIMVPQKTESTNDSEETVIREAFVD